VTVPKIGFLILPLLNEQKKFGGKGTKILPGADGGAHHQLLRFEFRTTGTHTM
jgi:hypothetical protein